MVPREPPTVRNASTKLDPKKGAQTGVAMGASVGLGDFDLFKGVDVEGVSLKFQNAFDSDDLRCLNVSCANEFCFPKKPIFIIASLLFKCR